MSARSVAMIAIALTALELGAVRAPEARAGVAELARSVSPALGSANLPFARESNVGGLSLADRSVLGCPERDKHDGRFDDDHDLRSDHDRKDKDDCCDDDRDDHTHGLDRDRGHDRDDHDAQCNANGGKGGSGSGTGGSGSGGSGMGTGTASISGTVSGDNGSMAGWKVYLTNSSGTTISTTTDSTGAFSFANLAAGTYTVCEAAPAGSPEELPAEGSSASSTPCSSPYAGYGFSLTLSSGESVGGNSFFNGSGGVG
ncbi:MAG TPA: carboxypeptidase regulatory-like domain-containing protein [Gemmatimonadales bacterium]|nr:carboxypeptidase regulatory-like domain-containing protein [Gemmatimonadales bacterium]